MKHRWNFVWLILILLVLTIQACKFEFPDPDHSIQNGNELLYLQHNIPYQFIFNNTDDLSSIGLNFSLVKDLDTLTDSLTILIEPRDTEPKISNIPLAYLFFSSTIKIPLGYTGDEQAGEFQITLITNAPDNALAIFRHPDEGGEIDQLANPMQMDYLGYREKPLPISSADLLLVGSDFLKIILIAAITLLIGIMVFSFINWQGAILFKEIHYVIFYGLAALPLIGFAGYYLAGLKYLSGCLILLIISGSFARIKKLRQKGFFFADIRYINLFEVFILLLFPVLVSLLINRCNPVAPWVDGLKHQEIISAIIERDRDLFLSGYHIGFHLQAFLIDQLHLVETHCISLLLGQFIYSLSGLAMFLFVREITGNKSLAFLSAIIISICLPFPMYLLNWARYPFLHSIILLLPLLALINQWLRGIRGVLPATVCLTLGMSLIHYGAIFLIATFLLAGLVVQRLSKEKVSLSGKEIGFLVFILLALLVYIVLSIINRIGFAALIKQQIFEGQDPLSDLGLIFKGFGGVFILLALAGWITALKHERKFLVLHIWFLFLILGTFLQLLLFKTLLFGIRNLLAAASIFIAIYSAYYLQRLSSSVRSIFQQLYIDPALVVILGLLGLSNCISLISPSIVSFNQADYSAMNWIEKNTEKDSLFLVNSIRWGQEQVSSDAGGWIPYITGRKISLISEFTSGEALCDFINTDHSILYYEGADRESSWIRNIACVDLVPRYQNGVEIFSLRFKDME